mgnify:CR=1 FL=1
MSIDASLCSFEFDGRKLNVIDTPGEPSFVAEALAIYQLGIERGILLDRGELSVPEMTFKVAPVGTAYDSISRPRSSTSDSACTPTRYPVC